MMKFVELFWPKEMRELVNKYRAEGTLNEEAIRYVFKTQRSLSFMFLAIVLLVYIAAPDQNHYVILAIISVPALKWAMHHNYFKYVLPSTKGDVAHVKPYVITKRLHQPGAPFGWRIEYEYLGRFNRFSGISEELRDETVENDKGLQILAEEESKRSLPHIKSWIKIYNLNYKGD